MKYHDDKPYDQAWEMETELEKEYDALQKEASKLFDGYQEKITAIINEMKQVSEQYGVPFYVWVAGAGNEYVPESFERFMPLAEDELASEFFEIPCPEWSGEPSLGTWQRSYC